MFQRAGGGEEKGDDGGESERGGGMNSCQVSAVAMAFHQATPLRLGGLIKALVPSPMVTALFSQRSLSVSQSSSSLRNQTPRNISTSGCSVDRGEPSIWGLY
ncbi:unnamed protein product [Pleuronectes platessa]|uniref:Uncharacterized protein n=1 Tax=Pleuronectes platessa TaxID=8262 RepID=A0A9N7V0H6_PLEPL|nr:unnamed protein product [Pleuronectes platessa]